MGTFKKTKAAFLKWNNRTHMYVLFFSLHCLNYVTSVYITRRKSRFVHTHAGLLRRRTVGGSGGPSWMVCRLNPHSHRPALCCHNCFWASGCALSSWNLLWSHLCTSESSTSPWSPRRSAISVRNRRKKERNIAFDGIVGLKNEHVLLTDTSDQSRWERAATESSKKDKPKLKHEINYVWLLSRKQSGDPYHFHIGYVCTTCVTSSNCVNTRPCTRLHPPCLFPQHALAPGKEEFWS